MKDKKNVMKRDSINRSLAVPDGVKAASQSALVPEGPVLVRRICFLPRVLSIFLPSAPISREQIAGDPGEQPETRNTTPRTGEPSEPLQVMGSKMKTYEGKRNYNSAD